jgi:hypothetical protein
MNRRELIKGIAAALVALPLVGQIVKPEVIVKAATKEFTDQPPFGFVPPSISCWPGQGKRTR